jgi:hypothetical protein
MATLERIEKPFSYCNNPVTMEAILCELRE